MDDRRLVGIGASAGGIEALLALVAGLDPAMPAAVLVVLHQAAEGPTVLADILDRRCPLDVVAARDGDRLEAGRVVVAPPDAHLQAEDGHVVLGRGPKENGHRPGVDPLFRSLAMVAGPGAIGVVLSGMLDDGATGLLDIVRHGGSAVVQDPDEAAYDSMPRAALEQVPGAVVRPAADIGPLLREITERRLPDGRGTPGDLAYEVEVSRGREPLGQDPPGPASGLTCPDCSGPLFDLGTEERPHYRCRVGHAWSPHSLAHEQDAAVEKALYTALRALEDKNALARRVADTARSAGAAGVADRARSGGEDALRAAAVLRGLLLEGTGDGTDVDVRDDGLGDGSG